MIKCYLNNIFILYIAYMYPLVNWFDKIKAINIIDVYRQLKMYKIWTVLSVTASIYFIFL